MTTLELLQYYQNLLIYQYLGQSTAYGTIGATVAGMLFPQTSTQQITFSAVAASGTFVLSYDGNNSAAIDWNDSTATIQSKLQAITGLSEVTVTGTIASQSIVITFTGVIPPALSLVLVSSTLEASNSSLITITIAETDLTLPLAIQNAFNLTGPNPAQGVQLDVLGKYVGVTRYGYGLNGQPITLSDSDFLVLIQIAITQNNNGSSLYDIVNLLWFFFHGQITCYDVGEMELTYFISDFVSDNLIQLFITENILPRPMGVSVTVIAYAPGINNVFGFVTYPNPVQPSVTTPFNTYTNYELDWHFLSYADIYQS